MFTSTEQLYAVFLQHPQICTDSRKPDADAIFFALSGPNFNGNVFAESALQNGCAYAVVDDPSFAINDRCLLVEDCLLALQDLARYRRRKLSAKFIGITGSNGKTTTKELLASVLRKQFRTFATFGNLNNHIGVPLTLLAMPADTEIAVIEMGASKQGDIKELVEIAEPDFGIITNIGKAHLEGMGGFDGVVKTKTELYDFIRLSGGKVFVNSIHDVFIQNAAGMSCVYYGQRDSDFVCGAYIDSKPYVRFRWKSVNDPIALMAKPELQTVLMGFYNFENLLAAAAVGAYFGISEDAINQALCEYNPDNNRSQMVETGNNLLIMDAYNANPSSMEAALHNFKEMRNPRKVLILGKMMELGETWKSEHERIAQLANETGADSVFFVGDLYAKAGINNCTKHFNDVSDAQQYFKENPLKGFTILIKGSRSNRLESLKDLF
jgi:UDP-N-acetylmuramoyl-tripeptide--D-alanyl-D-alanine ligase